VAAPLGGGKGNPMCDWEMLINLLPPSVTAKKWVENGGTVTKRLRHTDTWQAKFLKQLEVVEWK